MMSLPLIVRSVETVAPCEERASWSPDVVVVVSETESGTRRGWR